MGGFTQAGPTCGFYCLEYAAAAAEGREPDAGNVKAMVEAALAGGRTAAGEIFTRADMEAAFAGMYGDRLTMADRPVKGKKGIRRAAEKSAVILPVAGKRRHRPHYYVLLGWRNGTVPVYDPADPFHRTETPDSLLWLNTQVADSFDWDRYFGETRPVLPLLLVRDMFRSKDGMAKTARRARKNAAAMRRAGVLRGSQPVDLSGRMFLVTDGRGTPWHGR